VLFISYDFVKSHKQNVPHCHGLEALTTLPVLAHPPGLHNPAHGPGPHCRPLGLLATAPVTSQLGLSPAPLSPALPSHGPARRPMSRPGLGLFPSPGR